MIFHLLIGIANFTKYDECKNWAFILTKKRQKEEQNLALAANTTYYNGWE